MLHASSVCDNIIEKVKARTSYEVSKAKSR